MITIRGIEVLQRLDKTPLLPEKQWPLEVKVLESGVIITTPYKRRFIERDDLEKGIQITAKEMEFIPLTGEHSPKIPLLQFSKYLDLCRKRIEKKRLHDYFPVSRDRSYLVGSTLVLLSNRFGSLDILLFSVK